MPTAHHPSVARATLWLVIAVAAPAAVLAWWTGPTLEAARAPGAEASDLITLLALTGGWCLVARLAAVTMLVLAGRVPGIVGATAARFAQALTPRLLRSVVRVALGVGVAAGPMISAGVAMAAGPDPAQISAAAALPVLDRLVSPTAGAAGESGHLRSSAAAGRVGQVRVRAGDSLWSIAAAHLPRGDSQAQVAAAWPRWYAANRDTIGPDPSVLHPGQVLREPTP